MPQMNHSSRSKLMGSFWNGRNGDFHMENMTHWIIHSCTQGTITRVILPNCLRNANFKSSSSEGQIIIECFVECWTSLPLVQQVIWITQDVDSNMKAIYIHFQRRWNRFLELYYLMHPVYIRQGSHMSASTILPNLLPLNKSICLEDQMNCWKQSV